MSDSSSFDISGGGARYRIAPASEFPRMLEFQSLAQARAFLKQHVREAQHLMQLRQIVAQETSRHSSRLSNEELIDIAARLLLQGRWQASVQGRLSGSPALAKEAEEPERIPPTRRNRPKVVEEELTWIEIELIDEADQPVPGIEYRLRLVDGTIRFGKLNQDGYARVDGIEPGTCEVTFPDLDEEAWEWA